MRSAFLCAGLFLTWLHGGGDWHFWYEGLGLVCLVLPPIPLQALLTFLGGWRGFGGILYISNSLLIEIPTDISHASNMVVKACCFNNNTIGSTAVLIETLYGEGCSLDNDHKSH